MSKNSYYYYDHNECAFVEVKPKRHRFLVLGGSILSVAAVLAVLAVWGLSHTMRTPAEIALQQENEALQEQLSDAVDRAEDFFVRVEKLEDTEKNLFSTMLQAEPLSDDVAQMGVGGTDVTEKYAGFSTSTSKLLSQTSKKFDLLERKLDRQRKSYGELKRLAARREEQIRHMPAILPITSRLSSGFGMRRHPIYKVQKMHTGVDFVAASGTPIYATADGTIHFAGMSGGYGRVVRVRHEKANRMTLYAHLSSFADGIREGTEVKRGQIIAYSGNTGVSTAPHLHYEVRTLDNKPLNPVYTFVPGMTPAEYRRMLKDATVETASLD